jgi:hypothetical protein
MIATTITTGVVALEVGAGAEAVILERKEVVAVPWSDTTLVAGEGVTHHLHPRPMRSDKRWRMKKRVPHVVPDHQVGNCL